MSESYQQNKGFTSSINRDSLERFQVVPFDRRILFLSHCIKLEQKTEIREFAEKLGYKIFDVGGGSIVHKIIEREKPDAVVGIACFPELEMAVGKIDSTILPYQIVELETDGCKETTVSVEESKRVLSLLSLPPELQT